MSRRFQLSILLLVAGVWLLLLPIVVQGQQATCIPEGGFVPQSFIQYVADVEKFCADAICCPGLVCQAVGYLESPQGEIDEVPLELGVQRGYYLGARCKRGEGATSQKQEAESKPVTFEPQITIPGSITIGGKEFSIRKGVGIPVTGDTLGQYLAVFYRFFVAAIAVMAVVMVMWGGFKRIYAAGSPERIKDANDVIFSALAGLVIALLAYSLLNLINPKLVQFKTLDVTPVTREGLAWETEQQLLSQAKPDERRVQPDSAINLSVSPGVDYASMDATVVDGLLLAAQALAVRGYGMQVTSAYRDPEKQKELIRQNCQNPPGSKTCNPKPGKPPTCIMANGPYSCPHTSGKAIDVWGTKAGVVCIQQILPKGNQLTGYCSGGGRLKCLENDCQKALIEEIKKQGFCRLCSEPWHFEKPKVSSGCTC